METIETATTETTTKVISSTDTMNSNANDNVLDRFECLQKVISKGMERSRKALNTTDLVEGCYGEDAVLFGGTEMLVGTVEDMLDKVHERVDTELQQYLQSSKKDNTSEGATTTQETVNNKPMNDTDDSVKGLLQRVDATMAVLTKMEERLAQKELNDQRSAVAAMDASLLPPGVTLPDLVQFVRYQQGLEEKVRLEQALAQIQEEIATFEREQASATKVASAEQRALDSMAKDLTRSADVCSMVAMS